jgi:hypothetical protein
MNNDSKYADIINLPHHVSASHPQMSIKNRAAQFSPFAALTGYDVLIGGATDVANQYDDTERSSDFPDI